MLYNTLSDFVLSLSLVLLFGLLPLGQYVVYTHLTGDLLLDLFDLGNSQSDLAAVFLYEHLVVGRGYRAGVVQLSGDRSGDLLRLVVLSLHGGSGALYFLNYPLSLQIVHYGIGRDPLGLFNQKIGFLGFRSLLRSRSVIDLGSVNHRVGFRHLLRIRKEFGLGMCGILRRRIGLGTNRRHHGPGYRADRIGITRSGVYGLGVYRLRILRLHICLGLPIGRMRKIRPRQRCLHKQRVILYIFFGNRGGDLLGLPAFPDILHTFGKCRLQVHGIVLPDVHDLGLDLVGIRNIRKLRRGCALQILFIQRTARHAGRLLVKCRKLLFGALLDLTVSFFDIIIVFGLLCGSQRLVKLLELHGPDHVFALAECGHQLIALIGAFGTKAHFVIKLGELITPSGLIILSLILLQYGRSLLQAYILGFVDLVLKYISVGILGGELDECLIILDRLNVLLQDDRKLAKSKDDSSVLRVFIISHQEDLLALLKASVDLVKIGYLAEHPYALDSAPVYGIRHFDSFGIRLFADQIAYLFFSDLIFVSIHIPVRRKLALPHYIQYGSVTRSGKISKSYLFPDII